MSKFYLLILIATVVLLSVSCSPNTPALSGYVVFVSDQNGNRDIFIMDANGQNIQQLTDNPTRDESPSWSPDGRQIAFISDRDGNHEIYTMNVDGSNQTRRTNTPDVYEDFPSWSPDGKRIVFSADPGYLGLLDLVTGTTHAITDGTDRVYENNPSWSPDGQQIVFESADNSKRYIKSIRPDGSNSIILHELVYDDGILLDPTWSPDGSQIVFGILASSERAGGGTFIMSSDGSNAKHLFSRYSGSSWSPDGEWLVTYSSVDGNNNFSEIYIINISDGAKYRITNTPYNESNPAWSP